MKNGIVIVILALLMSAFKLSNDEQEKCSIKEETPCADPAAASDDKSYIFRSPSVLDSEAALKLQLSSYQELREKLHKNRQLKIFVITPTLPKPYEQQIREHIAALKTRMPEHWELLSYLDQVPKNALLRIRLLPRTLQAALFAEVPFSRFQMTDTNYTEHVFLQLASAFPRELEVEDVLSEAQKTLVLKPGALAILVAQGLAKSVHPKLETKIDFDRK